MVGWEVDAHQSFWRGFGILLEVHRRRGLHEKASERPFIQSAEEACHLRGAEAAEFRDHMKKLKIIPVRIRHRCLFPKPLSARPHYGRDDADEPFTAETDVSSALLQFPSRTD